MISLADQIVYVDMHLQSLTREHKRVMAWYERNSWGEYDLKDEYRYSRRANAQLRTVRAVLETLQKLDGIESLFPPEEKNTNE
jgi:hypothetical protein